MAITTVPTDNGARTTCNVCGYSEEHEYAPETVFATLIDPDVGDRIHNSAESLGAFMARVQDEFDATHICKAPPSDFNARVNRLETRMAEQAERFDADTVSLTFPRYHGKRAESKPSLGMRLRTAGATALGRYLDLCARTPNLWHDAY